jgi:hypothetical protein
MAILFTRRRSGVAEELDVGHVGRAQLDWL